VHKIKTEFNSSE